MYFTTVSSLDSETEKAAFPIAQFNISANSFYAKIGEPISVSMLFSLTHDFGITIHVGKLWVNNNLTYRITISP